MYGRYTRRMGAVQGMGEYSGHTPLVLKVVVS